MKAFAPKEVSKNFDSISFPLLGTKNAFKEMEVLISKVLQDLPWHFQTEEMKSKILIGLASLKAGVSGYYLKKHIRDSICREDLCDKFLSLLKEVLSPCEEKNFEYVLKTVVQQQKQKDFVLVSTVDKVCKIPNSLMELFDQLPVLSKTVEFESKVRELISDFEIEGSTEQAIENIIRVLMEYGLLAMSERDFLVSNRMDPRPNLFIDLQDCNSQNIVENFESRHSSIMEIVQEWGFCPHIKVLVEWPKTIETLNQIIKSVVFSYSNFADSLSFVFSLFPFENEKEIQLFEYVDMMERSKRFFYISFSFLIPVKEFLFSSIQKSNQLFNPSFQDLDYEKIFLIEDLNSAKKLLFLDKEEKIGVKKIIVSPTWRDIDQKGILEIYNEDSKKGLFWKKLLFQYYIDQLQCLNHRTFTISEKGYRFGCPFCSQIQDLNGPGLNSAVRIEQLKNLGNQIRELGNMISKEEPTLFEFSKRDSCL